MKRPAIFIDRDGTICKEVGYLNDAEQLQIYSAAATAIRMLNERGWLVIVISNQSGVARGYFTESLVIEINELMRQRLELEDAKLDALYYCPHHPVVGTHPYLKDCDCRKPKIGMVEQATNAFEIDIASSWAVGDRYSDVELAHNSGLHSAMVLTGYGQTELQRLKESGFDEPELVGANLLEVVKAILSSTSNKQLINSMIGEEMSDGL